MKPVRPRPTPTAKPTEEAPTYDRAYALTLAGNVIDDITSTDERVADGDWGSASSSLNLLADSFQRLGGEGFPRGVNHAKYYAQVKTLESFSRQASNEIFDDPTAGSARYAVIREQTAPLMKTLNRALGSNLRLP